MIAVPTVATERASAEFVFTHFNTKNDAGIHSNLYIFVLGLLMSQYTLTGYDASAHMVQKTSSKIHSSTAKPLGHGFDCCFFCLCSQCRLKKPKMRTGTALSA
jgi:hypothetical protein